VVAALFAFLHHVAAFAFVAALVLELVLLKDDFSLRSVRKLLYTDTVVGAAAAIVLVVGLLRAFYFEKGVAYYFHSGTFIAKLSLFVLIALISIYPTVQFLSWRKATAQGQTPSVDADTVRKLRAFIHCELVLVVLLILCAALMARGIGYIG
jgi:putative membrane protein